VAALVDDDQGAMAIRAVSVAQVFVLQGPKGLLEGGIF
jgi:hypothetical protein